MGSAPWAEDRCSANLFGWQRFFRVRYRFTSAVGRPWPPGRRPREFFVYHAV